MTANFQVIVEPEDDVFVTYVPALDFASTYGATRDEALARTRELIVGYLEAARQEGITIDTPPVDHRTELVDLAVPA
jgi:predicted RNase H-like HicB family nuclease